jgi:hypothetical protein
MLKRIVARAVALATMVAGFAVAQWVRSGDPGYAPPPSHLALRPYAACLSSHDAPECAAQRRAAVAACRLTDEELRCLDLLRMMEGWPPDRVRVLTSGEPRADTRAVWFRTEDAAPVRGAAGVLGALILALSLIELRRPPVSWVVFAACVR